MPSSATDTHPEVGPGSTRAGHFVIQNPGFGEFRAFIPAPLSPDPPLLRSSRTDERLQRASLAVGRLDGISRFLPNADAFIYMYIRKEAVLSSQIEGTQSTLSDLLKHEHEGAPGVPTGDVEEVSNYVRAMYRGLELLRGPLPLSLRLIREVHRTLVSGTRGADKTPGEFRRSQNWIGGSRPGNARYVPPPPHEVMPALGALEKFMHDDPVPTPPLLKAGFVHAQFETIHPFLDGNGRVGRLLITMILLAEKVLAHPMLYMSLYFKRNQTEYYERLQRVRTHGDWEGWIDFYLEGITSVATQAVETIDKLHTLFAADRAALERVGTSTYQQTATLNNLRVYDLLCRRIALNGPETASELGISRPTASRVLQELESLGIVQEVTGQARNRLYLYKRCVHLLEDGA